ncbi:MAG: FAD-dependent oxidoreductase, partial [Thiohalocapsa sp.]|nr:FAD-dependent oxidoreductase [Thiohalocapsa sp.]
MKNQGILTGADGEERPARILIVGGGFAGATAARHLERRLPKAEIRLLSSENYLTYNPLLAEVVGASVLPGHVVAPLRQMFRRTRVHQVDVTAIDTAERRVAYRGLGPGSFRYDHLLIACGSRASLELVPGMAEHALPLKSVGDALHLRNRIVARLEEAELEPDPEMRRWLTTFVIIGGGFSGVEVAGEISDFVAASRRWYRHLDAPVRVIIVHGGAHLMPELPVKLGRFTERKLPRRAGVEVLLNTRGTGVDARGIELGGGTRLDAGTIVSTVGTGSTPLIDRIPAEKLRGRLRTAPELSVPGVSGPWAVGDCAAIPNGGDDGPPCPPTAQF